MDANAVIRSFDVTHRERKDRLKSLGRVFGDYPKSGKRISIPFAQHPIGSNLYLRLGAVGKWNKN